MGPLSAAGAPTHTCTCLSVEARLPEGPTYCQVSRKKDPSFSPSSALTRGHPHPRLGRPGRLEGWHVPAAQGRGGERRGAQGARAHYTVRMGAQGRQRAGRHARLAWHEEAGWAAVEGTGLGAEQGGSPLSGARWDRGQLPQTISRSTERPFPVSARPTPRLAAGGREGSQEEPASVGSPCNVRLSGSSREEAQGKQERGTTPPAGPHLTPLSLAQVGSVPWASALWFPAATVAMETLHPCSPSSRGLCRKLSQAASSPALCGLRVGFFSQLDSSQLPWEKDSRSFP